MSAENERDRILIVDDEVDILESIRSLLEDDFEVHTASSVDAALEILSSVDPAVLLTDQRMPGKTGDELLTIVRERCDATRILVTGYADLDAVARAVNAGQIFAYVTKPWRAVDLVMLVTRAAEQHRLSRELAQERELLRGLLAHAPDAIFFKDRERRYLRANVAMAKRVGVDDPATLIGQRFEETCSDPFVEAVTEEEQRIIDTGEPVLGVERPLRQTGALAARWYSISKAPLRDEQGQVNGLLGIARDITERKRAEAEIRSLARFHAENPNPMMRVYADGRAEDANSAACALLTGWNGAQAAPPALREATLAALAAKEHRTVELVTGDRTVLFNVFPAPEEAYVNAFGEDVTEQRKLDERMRQSQKLEAVGRLTGGVAHDFNNRLTVIMGNLELLESMLEEEQPAIGLVRNAFRAAQGGAQLNRQLLAFSRGEVLEPRAVDVGELLAGLREMVYRSLGETVEVVVDVDAGLPAVKVDPGRLEDVLINLSVNARDAMPGGGRLHIEARGARVDAEDAAEEMDPGDYVRISVTDTGEGISGDNLRQVFEPFFSTKAPGKGTGLGLSMVYGFVKQSDGFINVRSELGVGTCFEIHLPAVGDGYEAPRARARAALQPVPAGNFTVLVVEDEPSVRDTAVKMLRTLGYRTLDVDSGREAMACLARGGEVDLVFSDVVMPGGISGIDFAESIRECRPDLPIVLASGYSEQHASEAARARGDLFWISKPYRRVELQDTLAAAIASRGQHHG